MVLKLPPLNALKHFESACRNGSYVLAAQELHVSAAAVSQQVKNLERFFDKQLFVRRNNAIVLTDAGMALYENLTPALRELSASTSQLLAQQVPAKLNLSVLPSLASTWLTPRLATFSQGNPNVNIHLHINDDPVDMVQTDTDLRICYGQQFYRDFRLTKLFTDQMLPMCSPQLAQQLGLHENGPADQLQDLPAENFLHINWGSQFASLPTWQDWFEQQTHKRLHNLSVGHSMANSVAMTSVGLDMASANMGIILGQRKLAQSRLGSGELIILNSHAITLKHAYYAATPYAQDGSINLQALMQHLVD